MEETACRTCQWGEKYCFVGDTVVIQHKFVLLFVHGSENLIVSATVRLTLVSSVLYSCSVGQLAVTSFEIIFK